MGETEERMRHVGVNGTIRLAWISESYVWEDLSREVSWGAAFGLSCLCLSWRI